MSKVPNIDDLLANESSEPRNESTAKNEILGLGQERRDGSFRIDQRDAFFSGNDKLRHRSDALAVDPTDFVDQVTETKEKNKIKNILLSFGATFLLIGFVYLGFQILSQAETGTVKTPPTAAEEARFMGLYPDAPTVQGNTTMVLQVEPERLILADILSRGYELFWPEQDFEELEFKAVAAKDFGPAATTDDGETVIYLFKDMAHSLAFNDATNGESVTVKGAAAAAVMTMELPTGAHNVLAIVNPDSSGLMIVLPTEASLTDAKNLAEVVEVQETYSEEVALIEGIEE